MTIITDLNQAKGYEVILADPPWNYKTYSNKGKGRSAESHYPTMTKEEIQKLPISQIAAENCVLFLWVTPPCLKEGLELLETWGFTYKTKGFNWVKRNKKTPSWFFGMGFWTRANAEDCLIATRGKPKRESASVSQIIDSPIREHSRKPDEAYGKIEELMGNKKRIELFARQEWKGWDAWGNEVTQFNRED